MKLRVSVKKYNFIANNTFVCVAACCFLYEDFRVVLTEPN